MGGDPGQEKVWDSDSGWDYVYHKDPWTGLLIQFWVPLSQVRKLDKTCSALCELPYCQDHCCWPVLVQITSTPSQRWCWGQKRQKEWRWQPPSLPLPVAMSLILCLGCGLLSTPPSLDPHGLTNPVEVWPVGLKPHRACQGLRECRKCLEWLLPLPQF